MKSKITLILLLQLVLFSKLQAQVATPSAPNYYWSAKEFSKDIALFRAKAYVVGTILDASNDVVQFEMDPLAAASSGELTSLVYKSAKQSKEGLILGFFGSKWNPSGVTYQPYAFKNLPSAKAIELLNLIEKVIKDNTKYLNTEPNSNNITFKFDDLTFIISFNLDTNIRVFWDDFDANWDGTAFKRTKRRLLKKLE
ncbi:hypothetical protein [Pedobacter jeongneungensis]|uniref:hypothetical protein n=1 Tax=Pedobacter jeongneungensis TaxID=947309 RepID=UPI00046A7D0D|nr:hypothetical protein [Pedobacter jeongneungensis]